MAFKVEVELTDLEVAVAALAELNRKLGSPPAASRTLDRLMAVVNNGKKELFRADL